MSQGQRVSGHNIGTLPIVSKPTNKQSRSSPYQREQYCNLNSSVYLSVCLSPFLRPTRPITISHARLQNWRPLGECSYGPSDGNGVASLTSGYSLSRRGVAWRGGSRRTNTLEAFRKLKPALVTQEYLRATYFGIFLSQVAYGSLFSVRSSHIMTFFCFKRKLFKF